MGYEREFTSMPRQELVAIDTLVIQTLEDFVPTERYALRDVILDDEYQPLVVARDQPTPLTPDILYREIRDKYFVEATCTWGNTPSVPSTPCISRWFNAELEAEYAAASACIGTHRELGQCKRNHGEHRACYYESGLSEIDDFLQEDLNIGEFGFFIPREPTRKERSRFDSEYHPYLVSHGHYVLYHRPEGDTYGLTFTTPDIKAMYELRRSDFIQAATAYAQNAKVYMTAQGIDVDDPTEDEEDKFFELGRIMDIKKRDGVSISEAVERHIAYESFHISREMQVESEINVYSTAAWVKVRRLLGNFINQIVDNSAELIRQTT